MNNVALIGRLTKDPELKYTPNTRTAVCRFTLAIDRPKRDGKDMGADFIRIVVWGKMGENCDKYLDKGRQVAVKGHIQTGRYEDRDGKTVYTTDVVADNVEFLGKKEQTEPRQDEAFEPQEYEPQEVEAEQVGFDSFAELDEDIPF